MKVKCRGGATLKGARCVTIDQLQQEGAISFPGANRWGYNYTADVNDGQHFKITAAPSDPAKIGWPTLWIDENMEVTR